MELALGTLAGALGLTAIALIAAAAAKDAVQVRGVTLPRPATGSARLVFVVLGLASAALAVWLVIIILAETTDPPVVEPSDPPVVEPSEPPTPTTQGTVAPTTTPAPPPECGVSGTVFDGAPNVPNTVAYAGINVFFSEEFNEPGARPAVTSLEGTFSVDCSGFPEEMFPLILHVKALDWCAAITTNVEVAPGEVRESSVNVYVTSKPFETNIGFCIRGGHELFEGEFQELVGVAD